MSQSYSSQSRGEVDAAAPRFTPGALVTAAIVVAGLYFSRDVLVPFVLAVILSFVLAIPVRLLQNRGLGRLFPVGLVVVVAFGIILTLGAVLTTQLAQLAGDLPRYQTTIRDKIATLKGAASGHGPLERVADMLQQLSGDLAGGPRPGGERARNAGEATVERPMPVEVVSGPTSPLNAISGYVAPILHPLATAGLIAVFVVFILLQREDLRNRAIRLAGSHDLQRTTAAMNDAARRLSRYFLLQVSLNATFGIVTGLGLWAIGVPSPILWGILAAISRFVPYVGVVLAAGGPLLLSAAVDPNWTMLIFTAGFFVASEFTLGQIVEPLLYGHSTGLSPLAVIASVTFWTWLWGALGLLLATPLTLCLVVLGRHVEQLEFLDVMFGDRPPLTVAESFYQRMLAGDAGEAIEQAELFLKDHSLATYYDEIAIKGLALGQVDLARDALDELRLARIETTVDALVEELGDYEDEVPDENRKVDKDTKRAAGDADLDRSLNDSDATSRSLPVLGPDDLPADWKAESAVLCIAGRNGLDRAGAQMLAQILAKHGLPARIEGAQSFAPGGPLHLPDTSVRLVCLSYLDTSSPVHVRYAVRRLRRRLPAARIVVGAWGVESAAAKSLCEQSRSDACASRLIEAAQFCLEWAGQAAGKAADQTVAPPAASVSTVRASAA